MKNCPVCGAACFEDMEMCFDCLHQFGNEEGGKLESALPAVLPDSAEDDLDVIFAEYSKVPPDCSEGTSKTMHSITIRIPLPEGAGEFSIQCENLRIEGSLA